MSTNSHSIAGLTVSQISTEQALEFFDSLSRAEKELFWTAIGNLSTAIPPYKIPPGLIAQEFRRMYRDNFPWDTAQKYSQSHPQAQGPFKPLRF